MLHNKKLYLSVLTVVTLLAFAMTPLAVLADDPPEEVPIEEPVAEPVAEPAEEPIEEPVEEAVEAPIEEPIEEPVGEAAEETTTDDSAEQPIEDPIAEPAEEIVADEPAAADPAAVPAGVSGSALGSDSMTHNTSWAFQNLGSATANVGVEFYNTSGANTASDSFTVANSASFWAPTYAPLGTGSFNGGLVASSDQPLAAISNQVAVNNVNGRTNNATYRGFSDSNVAPTMYVPVLMKDFAGFYFTEMSVQNAGSADVTANVTYYNEDGTTVGTVAHTVKANSPTRIAQSAEAMLPAGWIGSAKVAAAGGTTPLAVVVNEYVGSPGGMYNQFYSYEGFAAGATTVYVPVLFINGYGGWNASVAVQNLGGAAATTDWSYYDTTPGNPSPGTVIHTETGVSIPTSRALYYPNASFAQTLMDAYQPGDNAWVGMVKITSTQPLVAIANELFGSNLAGSNVGVSAGATELNYPLAFDSAYGYANTSFAISDVSGTAGAVNVTVAYIADTTQCPGCTNWSDTYSFTNNDSKYQPDHIPASAKSSGVYVGSIKITVNTAGKTINGVMNELLGGDGQDNFTSFNGFTP
jgi:hypothetical protein